MPLPGELRLVADVAAAFCDLFVETNPQSVALSGGGTAEACYSALAARAHDWSSVDVYFGDERFVPPDHPESNEGMARRVLLDRVNPRTIHPMYRPLAIDEAARAYDALVRDAPPIALVHLGLGPDGHTASLFPRVTRARRAGAVRARDG
jgi:6-phosphogluconolactonase